MEVGKLVGLQMKSFLSVHSAASQEGFPAVTQPSRLLHLFSQQKFPCLKWHLQKQNFLNDSWPSERQWFNLLLRIRTSRPREPWHSLVCQRLWEPRGTQTYMMHWYLVEKSSPEESLWDGMVSFTEPDGWWPGDWGLQKQGAKKSILVQRGLMWQWLFSSRLPPASSTRSGVRPSEAGAAYKCHGYLCTWLTNRTFERHYEPHRQVVRNIDMQNLGTKAWTKTSDWEG